MEQQSGYGGLRRKDTLKGPPLRVLSLDGGGVRGYSMLIILQELMHRTFVEVEGRAPKRHEIPKPCDHFDLIAGTGTGGLIALMLGRLRLDIETCKDVYVRMTKRVFETDKTIAGIPYRSTLFKASKLEEAIRECVREHTISEYEGNDGPTDTPIDPRSSMSAGSTIGPQRTLSNGSRYSQIGTSPVHPRSPMAIMRWGNPNALLYDSRENRTKTAVTAVYKGTPKGGNSIFLRSYDSRKEPSPEFNCTIWQAGRATSATGLAFKPIQIGQSMFIDEGAGTYNPAPQVLDEAVCNEWPGRDIGVFVSIGTGKRPKGTGAQQQLWWEGFVSSSMGDFAEARRRLIAKIEGCEDIHQYMIKEHLAKRGVNPENYYRLNVEVGVGEFGMNEWNRLAEISTNTRRYLSKDEVKNMNFAIAAKLGRINFMKSRWDRQLRDKTDETVEWDNRRQDKPHRVPLPSNPIAVELPAEDVPGPHHGAQGALLRPSQARRPLSYTSDEKIVLGPDEYGSPSMVSPMSQRNSGEYPVTYRRSHEQLGTPSRISQASITPPSRRSGEERRTPPPLPPKTPIQAPAAPGATLSRPPAGIALPYPDTDGPPPIVNMARKPEFSR